MRIPSRSVDRPPTPQAGTIRQHDRAPELPLTPASIRRTNRAAMDRSSSIPPATCRHVRCLDACQPALASPPRGISQPSHDRAWHWKGRPVTGLAGTLLLLLSAARCCAGLVLLDDFDGGSLSLWTPSGGTWSASGGVARQNAVSTYGNTTQMLVLNQPMNGNFSFQVGVKTPFSTLHDDYGNDAVGIAFGIEDSTNYYFAHLFPGWPGGAIRIGAVIGGAYSFLPNFGYEDHDLGFTPAMDQFHAIRVDAVGSTYTVRVWNGSDTTGIPFSHSFTDARLHGTGVGLWNARGPGSFDHAYATVPEPSTYAGLSALGLVGFGLWRRARR